MTVPDQPTTGKQEFKCMQCGKILRSQYELQEHQKTHKSQQKGSGGGSTSQAGGGQSSDY
jgi:hypothetical protein